ncbi:MAG: AMP-binding protein [Clostridiales bacterium]|nr:AMP-binding protein [Clostridiales bacterium]
MIHYNDEATDRFLKQWNDNNDWIEAHTSGSTGTPKVIKLLKADMIASAMATCRFFSLNSSSIMVCPLSAEYIAGKMMIVRALVSRARLFMEKPSNRPLHEMDYMQAIDLLPVVPSQLKGLTERLLGQNFIVKNIIVGGAAMSLRDLHLVSKLNSKVYATYGMTETCSHVALREIGDNGDIYFALPGYEFHTDERGCLVIHSMTQSFNRLVTNDMVNLIDRHHFQWRGRFDNVIISGGLKIHPEQLELRITKFVAPGLTFFITSKDDEKWGQRVVMCVEGEPFDTTVLESSLRQNLKPHEVPREILFIKEFTRTSSGKIKRSLP